MGKGQRARVQRADKREEMKAKALKLKRRKKVNKILGLCAAGVVALGIVAVVMFNIVAATGYFLRNTVVMSTDNYKVDNAMMTYYLKNEYYTFSNQYSDYLSMYGLDTSKSLKTQTYGDSTWFDYFKKQAITKANDMLLWAEKAKAEGYELDDKDKAAIDDSISSMKSYAEQNKFTFEKYLSSIFDRGMNEKDVRRALELSSLASKYYNDYSDSLTYTNEDLQNYFNENKPDYVKADCIKYGFTAEYASDADDATIQAAKDAAKAQATEFINAKSVSEFENKLTTYLTTKEEQNRAKQDSSEGSSDSATSVEETVTQELTSAKSTVNYPEEDSEDVAAKWIFADGRKIGDTYLAEPAEDATTFTYTAYIVTATSYFDDFTTVNARHILFTTDTNGSVENATAKAQEVLDKYNAGDKTEDAFIALAKENSEDSTVGENGGLYENITKDTANYPESFVNWCYDSSRKIGDVGIVSTDSSVHILYYSGTGDIAWRSTAKVAKNSEDCESYVKSLADSYKVKTSDSKISKINA